MKLECAVGNASHGVVIVHQQNALGATRQNDGSESTRPNAVVRTRQIDAEERADARCALHPDIASALLHDAVHSREAEARSLPRSFRREEGIEDAGLCGAIHPDAVVRHVETHVGARRLLHTPSLELVAQFGVVGADRDAAVVASTNRVARVHHEIENDLFDLPGIGQHFVQLRVEIEKELTVFTKQEAQHSLEVAHARVQVERLGAQELAPAEGEQLRRECRRAIRGFVDLDEILRRFAPVLEGELQEGGESLDGGEQIVEVMRDSARQQSDSLHLLRHAELRFELSMRGDVGDHHDDSGHDPFAVAEW